MRSYLTRIGALAATGAMLFAFPMCAKDTSSSGSIPGPAGNLGDEDAARAALANAPLGHVVTRDAQGRARFVMGETAGPTLGAGVGSAVASRVHLYRHGALLGLSDAAVRDAVLTATQELPGGASLVQYTQQVDGVPVFRARASVLLDAGKNLVSLTSSLHPGAAGTKAVAFPTTAESALANVYAAHFGRSLSSSAVRDLGASSYAVTTAADAPRLLDVTAKRVLFPDANALVPAYHVEFIGRAAGSAEDDGYEYVVSAVGGKLLYKASITANEKFKYKVWADATGSHTPADGPYVRSVPYKGAPVPSNVEPAFATPVDVEIDGFNKHGDPWLPAGATVTKGNNVHAYSDRNDQHKTGDAGTSIGDGFDPGVDVQGTATGNVFGDVYDVNAEPEVNEGQIRAAVTQLFYVNNWLHDYWYDSGFDETAGVAQSDNFGRGGVANDPIRAEAQDGALFGQANNANMSTPSDGRSPRMQMFVWAPAMKRKLETNPAVTFDDGWGAVTTYAAQTFDVPAGKEIVLSSDGSATPTLACAQPVNVSGKIAVIDRGGPAACTIPLKMQNAKKGGAIGVIFVNNAVGAPGLGGVVADDVKNELKDLPILTVSKRNGDALKAKLTAGAVTASVMSRAAEAPKHDGTIDNSVVAHEWGHYIHHRLVNCGSQSCGGMSEGWGDFNALFMTVRENDDLNDTVWPAAQYASAGIAPEGSVYYGIRRAPYSTSTKVNPFTFQHVRRSAVLPTTAPLAVASVDPSEVHNVGEIWAETLFEAYVNVLKNEGTFAEKKRRFATYLVAGMRGAPVEPTFTEQRDAILAAVLSTGNQADFEAIAKGFQKRGLGAGAASPPTSSESLDEMTEDFSFVGNVALQTTKLEETESCDQDGHLDAGEKGTFTVTLKNIGWLTLADTRVSLKSSDPNITFERDSDTVPSISPLLQTATVKFTVRVGANAPARGTLPITVTVANDASFVKTKDTLFETRYNYDDAPNTSATDDVESEKVAWTAAGDLHGWARGGTATEHAWHGQDIGTTTDERLVSPDLVVAASGEFKIDFKHRYSFEYAAQSGTTPPVYYDGGVLELSDDGGVTWKDISALAEPGYGGVLTTGNPLVGQKAWVAESAGYPSYVPVSLNLGSAFAGKTVKVRFRTVTDPGVGAPGWDIDDIAFGGITNKPFATVVDDGTDCHLGGGDAGAEGGTGGDSGTGDSGTTADSGTDADSGTSDAGTVDSGSGGDAGNGTPPRHTNDDSSCAVSAIGAVGTGSTGGAIGGGFFAGLLMLVRRRRRTGAV
ncbi:M36 family metallopeptidase [Pendulispora rubella]|uniref:M36 family metallopeptidase n=1 Tax=Pendulispora rubella TaxID=2741070 RepID=A0ABZ2LJL9_9BACT